jgi:hypothetical protein
MQILFINLQSKRIKFIFADSEKKIKKKKKKF